MILIFGLLSLEGYIISLRGFGGLLFFSLKSLSAILLRFEDKKMRIETIKSNDNWATLSEAGPELDHM